MKRNDLKITWTPMYLKSILTGAGWHQSLSFDYTFTKEIYVIRCIVTDNKIDEIKLWSTDKYIATTGGPYYGGQHYEHFNVPFEEIVAGAEGDLNTLEMRMNYYETRRAVEELD
jgi:hypothetical protein